MRTSDPKSDSVLVVDDDANIRAVVRMCLEEAGYSVRECPDGTAALNQVRRSAPDLILLDLAMPRLDGRGVLLEFGQHWVRFPSRVIVMTAHGSIQTAVEAIRLGASDFIEKPFTPDDLRLSVASVLNEKRAGAESPGRTAGATYDAVLAGVRQALNEGRLSAAETLLGTAGTITEADPTFLNLAGLVHEAHGRTASARRLYQRACAVPGGCEPAQRSLERLDRTVSVPRVHGTESVSRVNRDGTIERK